MASGIFYPAVSGDDGHWLGTGQFYGGNIQMYLGRSTTSYYGFVRCPNVTIPQGVTITSAYIRFIAQASDSSTVVNVNIYFNNIDDAIAPTSAAEGNALACTTAVAWDNIGSWSDGNQYNSPSLVSILQSVVNRTGWSSGNAIQVIIKDNGSSPSYSMRTAATIENVEGAEKAELHVEWVPAIEFTFTNPIPAHLSTVYGTTELLSLTTTVSGEEDSYVYDAEFYDGSDLQIGTTVLGINSGSSATSNAYLSTPSGIDYNWYVVATSSGSDDTSSTYTFINRFLYEGYVTENDNPISRKVNLYYRNTGELIDTTTSSGSNGYYKLSAVNNDTHFIVAFDDEAGEDYNALILDKLLPVGSE